MACVYKECQDDFRGYGVSLLCHFITVSLTYLTVPGQITSCIHNFVSKTVTYTGFAQA